MTSAVTDASKNHGAPFESLRNRVSELQGGTERLNSSLTDSRQRLQDLMAERGTLILPARSGKNDGAQKRLDAIDEALPLIKRDISDDEVALSELKAQLAAAQNELERAEWDARRASVRKLIERRLSGKTSLAIEKAVDALMIALQAAKDEDEEIKAAVCEFSPSLRREMKPLLMAARYRAVLAAWKLRDFLPVDSREFGQSSLVSRRPMANKQFGQFDDRHYGDLLLALDSLELVF